MRAYQLPQATGIDALVKVDLPQPKPAHRQVLVETYYCGRSVAEAAQVLGVPPGTVAARVSRCLRRLRDSLQESAPRAASRG